MITGSLLMLALAQGPVPGFVVQEPQRGISRFETAAIVAASVGDLASTEYGIRVLGRVEGNTLPGMQSSAGRVLVVGAATVLTIKAVDYLHKRKLKPLAWLVGAAHVTTRGFAIRINLGG